MVSKHKMTNYVTMNHMPHYINVVLKSLWSKYFKHLKNIPRINSIKNFLFRRRKNTSFSLKKKGGVISFLIEISTTIS